MKLYTKIHFYLIFIGFSGPRETAITGHSVWSHDAHVIMQDISHLKLMAMSLLQTCSYVTEQMQTPVTIDINKFMQSFSIKADDRQVFHPPSLIAGEDDSVTISPATMAIPDSSSSSLTASPDSEPYTAKQYTGCRRVEAIGWINLQEKQGSVIPRLHPVTPEEYQERRDYINSESGPLRRKGMKIHIYCWHSIHYRFL